MVNPYYNESFTAIDGNLAKARTFETQFAGIEDGFDRIRDEIAVLNGAGLHDPLTVQGTANQIDVATDATASPDVATVSLPSALVLPGTATYATGEPLGFKNIEQESISANYTTVLDDANRSKVHPASDTAARSWDLLNGAYRMGAAITFINELGAGVITLTATGGNFLMAGSGNMTSIAIAAAGGCTVIRIPGANRWFVSGAGITGTP